MDFLNTNTTQLLNSTIVDPSMVPRFNRTDQNMPSGSSDLSSEGIYKNNENNQNRYYQKRISSEF